jgi:hypothetical protein
VPMKAAPVSISVESSPLARELFTRFDTGHRGRRAPWLCQSHC